MKATNEQLAEYEHYIRGVAHKYFYGVNGADVDDFEQIGRVCAAMLIDEGRNKPYIQVSIFNAMRKYRQWQNQKKRKIITSARNLHDSKYQDGRHLIEILEGYPDSVGQIEAAEFVSAREPTDEVDIAIPDGTYMFDIRNIDLKTINTFLDTKISPYGESRDGSDSYELMELVDGGLGASDINHLIQNGILVGAPVTHHDITGAKLRRKFRTDSEYARQLRDRTRQNQKKAVAALRVLYQEPDFRADMLPKLRNSMAIARAVSLEKYRSDTEYRARMREKLRKNADLARQSLRKKLKDPQFHKKIHDNALRNLGAAQRKIDQLAKNDDWANRRAEICRQTMKTANAKFHSRYKSDSEFRDKVNEARRKGRKERWDRDPQYRAVALDNMRKSAKRRFDACLPRREALRDNVILPLYGDASGAYATEVTRLLETEDHENTRSLYPERKNLFNMVREDIKIIRNGLRPLPRKRRPKA
jgi:hypothetical protein